MDKQARITDFVPMLVGKLLLVPLLFMMAGCTTLTPDIPSDISLQDFPSDSRAEKTWKVEQTLVSNEVNCIAADSYNVWFATEAGVSRWQRELDQWTHYTMEDGLANDAVNAVAIDGDWIWFATDEGVSRYDMQNSTFATFRSIDGLASDMVSSIAVDGNYVWFGTSNGLNRYDKTIDSWAVRTRKDGLVSKVITTIAVEPEYVWVGTDKEINPDPHGWDEDPRFSKGGVSRYHRDTDSWNNYTKSDGLIDTQIATIAVDEDSVWFGTKKEGVSQYNQVDQTFIKTFTKTDLLKSNIITSIHADGFQVWFGTANAGVHRFIKPVNTWVHYTKTDGLSSNHVSWITTQGNDVWFGSKEDGVSRFDKVSGEWTQYKQADFLVDNDVRNISRDADGNLWIATASGVSIYTPQTQKWEVISKEDGLPTSYIMSIDVQTKATESTQKKSTSQASQMKEPQIWIATDRGLGSRAYSGGDWTFYAPQSTLAQRDAFVTALDTDEDADVIWLGTNSGPAKYDPASQKCISLRAKTQAKNTSTAPFISTVLSCDGSVWFGGATGILHYTIAEKKLKNASEGLPHPYVNVLLSTGTTLWAGTRNGVARYDNTQQRWEPMAFNKQLPFTNVTALAFQPADPANSQEDILWIGTPRGLGSYSLTSSSWKALPNISFNIRDILIDTDRTLWLATSVGLVEYRTPNSEPVLHQSRPERTPLREITLSNIKFDGDYVWFNNWHSSPNGCILRFHRPTETWQRFTRMDILKSTQKKTMTLIRWIYIDTDAVWFTTDLGVLRYDKAADTWEHFTREDGLSTNDVDKIAVSKHSVWVIPIIGMELNRYNKADGTWKVIVQEKREEIERVNALGVDGPEVWFGSGRGLHRYNETTGEWGLFTPRDGLAGRGAEWITVDDDFIWVARSEWDRDSNRPLSRYNKKTKKWTTFSTNDVLAAATVRQIISTKEAIWILYRPWNNAGVTRYDKRTQEWTTIKSGNGTTELATDEDYLWLATPNEGLRRFHFASGTWTSFRDRNGLLHNHTNEYGLAVDKDYVWVGTFRGLSRYDKQKESWAAYTALPTLADNTIRTVDTDERFVWVGTDNGMSRYDKSLGKWKNYQQKGGSEAIETHGGHWHRHRPKSRDTLSDNAISSIVVDEQYVWIGTRDGANRFDKLALRWDQYKTEHGLPANNVTAVSNDGNNIWVGTTSGIGKYPRTADDLNAWIAYTSGTEIQPSAVSKEFAESLVTDEIWCIATSKKHVWIGTRRGVSRYDIGRDTWRTITAADGLASNEVTCIAIDGNRVWFGSDRGVTVYNEKIDNWTSYTDEDGLASNKVTTIGVDGTDVWIGTYNAGISRFDQLTNRWTTYTRKDGLTHNGILSMAIGRTYVWFGTYRGLSRLDKRTELWTTFTESYGSEDIF